MKRSKNIPKLEIIGGNWDLADHKLEEKFNIPGPDINKLIEITNFLKHEGFSRQDIKNILVSNISEIVRRKELGAGKGFGNEDFEDKLKKITDDYADNFLNHIL